MEKNVNIIKILHPYEASLCHQHAKQISDASDKRTASDATKKIPRKGHKFVRRRVAAKRLDFICAMPMPSDDASHKFVEH